MQKPSVRPGNLRDPRLLATHPYVAPDGHAPEDLLDPVYWWPMRDKLQPGDRIQVDAEDASWFCTLRVMGREDALRGVFVALLGEVEDLTPKPPAGYTIEYRGSDLKWLAMRGGEILRKGFDSALVACAWLQQHAPTPEPRAKLSPAKAG